MLGANSSPQSCTQGDVPGAGAVDSDPLFAERLSDSAGAGIQTNGMSKRTE